MNFLKVWKEQAGRAGGWAEGAGQCAENPPLGQLSTGIAPLAGPPDPPTRFTMTFSIGLYFLSYGLLEGCISQPLFIRMILIMLFYHKHTIAITEI